MDKIVEIEHTGYRGPLTQGVYMPPGKWTVGDKLDLAGHIIPDEIMQYLVATGQAKVTKVEQVKEPDPAESKQEEAKQEPPVPTTETEAEQGEDTDSAEVTVDFEELEGPTEEDVAAARSALKGMAWDDLRRFALDHGVKLVKGITRDELINAIIAQTTNE